MSINDRLGPVASCAVQDILEHVIPWERSYRDLQTVGVVALQLGIMDLLDPAQGGPGSARHCNSDPIHNRQMVNGSRSDPPIVALLNPYSDDLDPQGPGDDGVPGLMEGDAASG